jgi:transcriptional regulator with XRE-family HTH domain
VIVVLYTNASMNKLAEIRYKRGITQRDLAQKAKINFVTIARIESGIFDPRLSTLRALAKALKVKVTDLIEE